MATKHTKTEHSVVIDNPSLGYLVINPYSDEDWLYERTFGVGASKCGVLLGCHMYKGDSKYQLWRNILGLNPPIEETWPMKKGHILEDYVARLFEKEFGFSIAKSVQGADVSSNWIAADRAKPYLRVSPDRIFWTNKRSRKMSERGILEIKSSCKMYEPEDLVNPDKCLMWYCQLQYQLHVMRLDVGYIGFIHDDGVAGGEHWFHQVKYNKDFCEKTLIPAIDEFWNNHIAPAKEIAEKSGKESDELNKFAPDLTDGGDVSTRYPQDNGESISAKRINLDELQSYIFRRDQIKILEKQQKEYEDAIKLIMMDSTSIIEDGKAIVTYKTNKPSMKFDSKSFSADHPDLYNKYCKETPGARVLKIK